jgi:hypothetical protein
MAEGEKEEAWHTLHFGQRVWLQARKKTGAPSQCSHKLWLPGMEPAMQMLGNCFHCATTPRPYHLLAANLCHQVHVQAMCDQHVELNSMRLAAMSDHATPAVNSKNLVKHTEARRFQVQT